MEGTCWMRERAYSVVHSTDSTLSRDSANFGIVILYKLRETIRLRTQQRESNPIESRGVDSVLYRGLHELIVVAGVVRIEATHSTETVARQRRRVAEHKLRAKQFVKD